MGGEDFYAFFLSYRCTRMRVPHVRARVFCCVCGVVASYTSCAIRKFWQHDYLPLVDCDSVWHNNCSWRGNGENLGGCCPLFSCSRGECYSIMGMAACVLCRLYIYAKCSSCVCSRRKEGPVVLRTICETFSSRSHRLPFISRCSHYLLLGQPGWVAGRVGGNGRPVRGGGPGNFGDRYKR